MLPMLTKLSSSTASDEVKSAHVAATELISGVPNWPGTWVSVFERGVEHAMVSKGFRRCQLLPLGLSQTLRSISAHDASLGMGFEKTWRNRRDAPRRSRLRWSQRGRCLCQMRRAVSILRCPHRGPEQKNSSRTFLNMQIPAPALAPLLRREYRRREPRGRVRLRPESRAARSHRRPTGLRVGRQGCVCPGRWLFACLSLAPLGPSTVLDQVGPTSLRAVALLGGSASSLEKFPIPRELRSHNEDPSQPSFGRLCRSAGPPAAACDPSPLWLVGAEGHQCRYTTTLSAHDMKRTSTVSRTALDHRVLGHCGLLIETFRLLGLRRLPRRPRPPWAVDPGSPRPAGGELETPTAKVHDVERLATALDNVHLPEDKAEALLAHDAELLELLFTVIPSPEEAASLLDAASGGDGELRAVERCTMWGPLGGQDLVALGGRPADSALIFVLGV